MVKKLFNLWIKMIIINIGYIGFNEGGIFLYMRPDYKMAPPMLQLGSNISFIANFLCF